ncbi:dephospho-CoA kinase [Tenacibaculum sp. 1B UA]|uniref:dephospho-CoA kinase n=1 Tax=unclassified Tenacibaculum TaxID=2635139 RepID=UPI0026E4553E|nr:MULTISPECIES: dephospho-CoA kinase [unclassified Tenacibaculum]MDO6674552.1 dephospho-CoA kinase [Tenacibaculum sp. 1_MG-2023]MDX8553794.1 dephospho-CoA kinase [Tenacibaculum sp. 1B UA]
MNSIVVGLTGGIGSGKSTIVKMFSEFENISIYIADDEAKRLMNTSAKIKTQLIAEFGEQVYVNDELNRSYLASIVFNNKERLSTLNAIVHPVVNKHLQHFIKENIDKDYILYENAILFENGSDSLCNKIITVTAPIDVRINRVINRDNSTIEEVKNRIKNQWDETKKTLQSNYLIENLTLTKSKEQVLKIHNSLTENIH